MCSARFNVSAQALGATVMLHLKSGTACSQLNRANLLGCHVLPDTSCTSRIVHLRISSNFLYKPNTPMTSAATLVENRCNAHCNDVLVLLYGKGPALQVWVQILFNLQNQELRLDTSSSCEPTDSRSG